MSAYSCNYIQVFHVIYVSLYKYLLKIKVCTNMKRFETPSEVVGFPPTLEIELVGGPAEARPGKNSSTQGR